MKNPEKIKEMFDKLAWKYDFVNGLISIGLHKSTKKKSVELLNIKNTDKILDICTGTGDLAYFMNKINPETEIIGADFSEQMLDIARRKNKNNKNQFVTADCTDLPFEDSSFDIVTMGFGLRNIEDTDKALSEINRVLKDGGTFLHLDFSCDKNFFNTIFDVFTPILVKLFYMNNIPYKYLIESKKTFYNSNDLIKKIEEKGFNLKSKTNFVFNVIGVELFRAKKREND